MAPRLFALSFAAFFLVAACDQVPAGVNASAALTLASPSAAPTTAAPTTPAPTTAAPTETAAPSPSPTEAPTQAPADAATQAPTQAPTPAPATAAPNVVPTGAPTLAPTPAPPTAVPGGFPPVPPVVVGPGEVALKGAVTPAKAGVCVYVGPVPNCSATTDANGTYTTKLPAIPGIGFTIYFKLPPDRVVGQVNVTSSTTTVTAPTTTITP